MHAGGPRDGEESSGSGDDLRRLLLDAAVELLREPDTPLDLRKVAERAGKSRTAPYLVFGKGEGGGVMALRIAVAAEGARVMSEMMTEATARAADLYDRMRDVADAFLLFVEENPRLFRLMYGSEINAIVKLGKGGFREHPEFERLLTYRDQAGEVVADLIREAQGQGILPEDAPLDETVGASGLDEILSVRYLQIAWATMIGVSVLREDDLLRVVGWDLSRDQGARVVAESVLGIDPDRTTEAARSFLTSPGLTEEVPAHGVEAPADAAWDDESAREREAFWASVEDVEPPPEPRELRARKEGSVTWGLDDEDELDRPTSLSRPSVSLPKLDARGPGRARETFSGVFRRLRDAGKRSSAAEGMEDVEADLEGSSTVIDGGLTEVLERYPGLRRAAYASHQFRGAHILWIDDHPDWVTSIRGALEHLGVRVTVVDSTTAALRHLADAKGEKSARVRVILSDIARGPNKVEGVQVLPKLAEAAPGVPVIFFVADYDKKLGTPPGAFGITNRTDELMHLIVDALEGR